MDKNYTVLVLGARGMLGRVVYRFLTQLPNLRVIGTHHQGTEKLQRFRVEFKEPGYKKIVAVSGKIDVVINCIGKLRSITTTTNQLSLVNTQLPLWLATEIESTSTRLVHISTDAVFPPGAGPVDEKSKTGPEDLYGQTKLAGEPFKAHALTIRTSIIGLDPEHKRGLIEWINNTDEPVVQGYTNQWWSGATVLQLTGFLADLIEKENFGRIRQITPVIHFAPLGPLTKANLIQVIAKVWQLDREIQPTTALVAVSRYLVTRYKKLLSTRYFFDTITPALNKLRQFEQGEHYEKN